MNRLSSGLAGTAAGPEFAAAQDPRPRVHAQAAFELRTFSAVAGVTGFDEHRPDSLFEEFQLLSRIGCRRAAFLGVCRQSNGRDRQGNEEPEHRIQEP